jgi:hypothetical protein
MTVRRTPRQMIREAKEIALAHNCFVTEKVVKDVTEFLVWRRSAYPIFIGSRRSPSALRTLVCKATNFK